MSTRTNRQAVAILVAVLDIVNQTKDIFELGREFDESNPYMKFGRARIIKD